MESHHTSSKENVKLSPRGVNKLPFCPPIFIFGANCTLISDLIKLAATECNVSDLEHKFVNMGYRKTKVYVNNSAVHKLVIDRLRGTGIGAFSFSPKDTKKVSILLKGLDGDTPVEKIKKALGEIVPNLRISKIAPFSTSRTKELDIKLNMFIVQLEIGESIKDLTSVRYLLCQRVYWEKKHNRAVMRCYRCQRFGHSGECCAYISRCVLCGENHDSNECINSFKTLKEKNEETPIPKCVNCNEIGHAASYQGCPAYLKYKEKKTSYSERARQAVSKTRTLVEESVFNFTNANVSFAEKAKTSAKQPNMHSASKTRIQCDKEPTPIALLNSNAQKSDLNDFLNEAKHLFNISFVDLLIKIRQFWPMYLVLKTKEEKMFSYLEFVASIVV